MSKEKNEANDSRKPDFRVWAGFWSISGWSDGKGNLNIQLQKYVKDKFKGSINFFDDDLPFVEQVFSKYKIRKEKFLKDGIKDD